MVTMRTRRLNSIVDYVLASGSDIAKWLSTLGAEGKWPDDEVDYTAGCNAQRANWPASRHWQRLLVMSAAWHGGLDTRGAEQWVGNGELRETIDTAFQWWFDNDFTKLDCLVKGGGKNCPCGTPGLWNGNWYSNVLLVPGLVSQTCLLLDSPPSPSLSGLSDAQLENCQRMLLRSYGTFDHGYAWTVGANLLQIGQIGVDEGLLVGNTTMLDDAFERIHHETRIITDPAEDGIHPDGSFGQHVGLLYNGNYGKEYINALLNLELVAAETVYAAEQFTIDAVSILFEGNGWMIYENTKTNVLHWDFSTLVRFITFPVADLQPTSGINLNLTSVGVLGEQWKADELSKFATSLSKSSKTANAGQVEGTKVFHSMDYLVHRGSSYVSTLKMYSSRILNSECTNSQNPFGFHLADGVRYTYVSGDEYEDISAAWDWNLIPGITTDYGATNLGCAEIKWTGAEAFVGGVSAGNSGIGAMRYTNPMTGALSFQKAWFFLQGDREHVMVSGVESNGTAPVLSVLDQKKHLGPVLVDGFDISSQSDCNEGGSIYEGANSLWHGDIGYIFSKPSLFSPVSNLVVKVGEQTGDWSAIGTSKQPPATVDLFTAYLDHGSFDDFNYAPLSYTTFPAISARSFAAKIDSKDPTGIQEIRNDASVSAIYDRLYSTAYAVFWEESGGALSFLTYEHSPVVMTSDSSLVVLLDTRKGKLIVSDPSQTLNTAIITLAGRLVKGVKRMEIELPGEAGQRGTATTRNIWD
jgi:hypothetical protein